MIKIGGKEKELMHLSFFLAFFHFKMNETE